MSNGSDPDQGRRPVGPDLGVKLFFKGYQQTTKSMCMLVNFSRLSCRLLTFLKLTLSKHSFRNTISVSNGLDPDQNRCLPRLHVPADDKTVSEEGANVNPPSLNIS